MGNESLEVQVARHDEQIKAIVTSIDRGFAGMTSALREHADEDRAAYADIAELKTTVAQAKSMWKFAVVVAVALSSAITMAYHGLGIAKILAPAVAAATTERSH